MKKILILSLFVVGCKSTPLFFANHFNEFEINKITENGIENVQIKPSVEAWPQVKYAGLVKNNIQSKKIKIAVLGDTGCRLKESGGKSAYQNCLDVKQWPYAEVVNSIVKENYDFAVHTGDYHYREHCTDKACEKYTKSIGYGWNAWWDDFYEPSLSLFKKSPIVFIRGNHEDCKRAYSGWGPLSALNNNFVDKCEEIEPYQWIEMGDLVFINFDDSAFEDRKKSSKKDEGKWLDLFLKINSRIAALKTKKEIWFLTHKPVAGFIPGADGAEPFEINPFLKNMLIESKLINNINYYLSGHIHNQQIITTDKSVFQIIVGHSGSALDSFGKVIKNNKLISTTATEHSFGYALFERQAFLNWKLIFKNQAGKTDMVCKLSNKKIKCN